MASRFLGLFGLGSKVNRADDGREEQEEGVIGEPVSELTLDKTDEELVVLKDKWERKWTDSKVSKDIKNKQDENERYWKGEHYTNAQNINAQRRINHRPPVDNVIWEGLETFLPVATRQIAEPMITSSQDPVAQEFAKKVNDRLVDVADTIRLRLKMKKAVRHWAIYFLGCLKFGWSMEKNEIVVQTIRPQQLILDPDAITDECEYEGEYIGHYRFDTISDLMARFGSKAKDIQDAVGKENSGTKISYIEWWTNDFLFWSLDDIILGKNKNPHWNYDQDQQVEREIETQGFDDFGDPLMGSETVTETIQGNNHFATRKVPFAFLSIFNLGKGPYDDTNQIEQALPSQDIINKRVRQIDKNADRTNGGIVLSGQHFNKEQAESAANALRKGSALIVPTGDVNTAFKQTMASPLPPFIYQDLIDKRNEVRNMFGTSGLSSEGIKSEQSVRGKILIKGSDTDRQSSIIDHIEQLYDYTFNWMVQLMMVYYDEPRDVSRTQGSQTIINTEFVHPLIVSVKEGSLIPKDRLTQRNEAIDLWSANAIGAEELFEKLEFADPKESAKNLLIWQMVQSGQLPPQVLFPDFPATLNQALLGQGGQEQGGQIGQPAEAPQPGILSSVPTQ